MNLGMGDFIDDSYRKRYQPLVKIPSKNHYKTRFSANDITDVFLTFLF